MEYVEGLPLLEYATTHDLDLEARLRLFLEICAAVEHAHRRLIVHRDLKPGNILVDAEGRAKLLDFGIAKVLSDEAPGRPAPAATVTRLGWMTPSYASPEQIRGEVTTTATDVYSLGLTLYELLVGRRAFGGEGKSTAAAEAAILAGDLERPSAAVLSRSADGEIPDAHAHRLERRLRGDLDTIVLQAVATESERRYGSVAELAAGMLPFLLGDWVLARRLDVTGRLQGD